MFPYVQVTLTGGDRRVFHAQLLGEFFHRAPAGVGVLDVGLGVQLEELELVVRELEQAPPALPLDAEPAALSELARAIARHVGTLGAGIGDDALEPVAVGPPPLPRPPPQRRRRQRRGSPDPRAPPADPHPAARHALPPRPPPPRPPRGRP